MNQNSVRYTVEFMREHQIMPEFQPQHKTYSAQDVPDLDPNDFNVASITQRGKIRVDGARMAQFLKMNRFYASPIGQPFRYNGMYYQAMSETEVMDFMVQSSRRISMCEMMTRSFKADIYSEWRSIAQFDCMEIPDSFYEDSRYDGWLIPFENGLYNVERDELLPFTPYVVFTHQIHADYIPMDYHPIEEVYKGIIPDDATRDLFFLALGYTLYAEDLNPPSIFTLLGPGDTGKSALLMVMRQLLGSDSVVDMNPYELSESFALEALSGKMANLCTEGARKKGSKYVVDGNRIKALVMGEELYINRKYQARVPFTNSAKMWFAANKMPDFGDTSSGLVRRIPIFPCREKQDPSANIYDLLCAPDALAYAAFRGLKAYVMFLLEGRNEFHDTPCMMMYKEDFREGDSVMEFLSHEFDGLYDKEFIRNTLHEQNITELYERYRMYMVDSGRTDILSRKSMKETISLEFDMDFQRKKVREGLDVTTITRFVKRESQ